MTEHDTTPAHGGDAGRVMHLGAGGAAHPAPALDDRTCARRADEALTAHPTPPAQTMLK